MATITNTYFKINPIEVTSMSRFYVEFAESQYRGYSLFGHNYCYAGISRHITRFNYCWQLSEWLIRYMGMARHRDAT